MSNDITLLSVAENKVGGTVDVVISIYTMQLVYVSEHYASNLGYSKEELESMKVRDIFESDYELMLKTLMRVFNKGGEQNKILKKKDGSKVCITGRAKSFFYEGEPYIVATGVIFTTVD